MLFTFPAVLIQILLTLLLLFLSYKAGGKALKLHRQEKQKNRIGVSIAMTEQKLADVEKRHSQKNAS